MSIYFKAILITSILSSISYSGNCSTISSVSSISFENEYSAPINIEKRRRGKNCRSGQSLCRI